MKAKLKWDNNKFLAHLKRRSIRVSDQLCLRVVIGSIRLKNLNKELVRNVEG